MHVLLVTMPWHALECPSLALGIVSGSLRKAYPGHVVTECYGSISWAEFLLEQSDGRIGPSAYTEIAETGVFHAIGDWVFSGALYGEETWRVQEFEDYVRRHRIDPGPAVEMQRHASQFIDRMTDEIVRLHPDVVGFTTTFMQNVPSLALAKRVKDLLPRATTVFGGGNCDGPMGPALHRNFPFVDFVISGEGERSFPMLVEAVSTGGELDSIPGLSWRSERGTHSNPPGPLVPMNEVPTPEYASYFDRLEGSTIREYVEPKLVLEGARGCWWGEKNQCTFCGLNGSMMKYRSKSGSDFWRELSGLVKKHRVLDVIMVDNILDMGYFHSLLPRLAESGWGLRLHYEVKSNLTGDQVSALRAAGVAHVQPGIENLSSRVLKLMKKGVTGAQNVQLLRDCEEHGLTVSWNYLYGFPGESASDYSSLLPQLPSLVHLQPPTGATRIALERFSPNFDDRDRLFGPSVPSECYSYVYDLSQADLTDMVYLFDTTQAGITGETETALARALDEWRANYLSSSLEGQLFDGVLHLDDRRSGRPSRRFVIDVPGQVAAYCELRNDTTITGLERHLAVLGHHEPMDEISGWLRQWKANGLVFEEDDRYVALATDPTRSVMRLPQMAPGGSGPVL